VRGEAVCAWRDRTRPVPATGSDRGNGCNPTGRPGYPILGKSRRLLERIFVGITGRIVEPREDLGERPAAARRARCMQRGAVEPEDTELGKGHLYGAYVPGEQLRDPPAKAAGRP
jgi:hypothetical protein